MKTWWLVILLLLSVGLNLGMILPRLWSGGSETPLEIAMEPGGPETMGEEATPVLPRVFYRMADELRLAGDERRAFLDLQQNFFERTRAARLRISHHQSQMRRELVAAEPNRTETDRLLEELAGAHSDLERAFVSNLLDTRELLSGRRERLFLRMMGRLWQSRADLRRRPPARLEHTQPQGSDGQKKGPASGA